MPLRVGADGEPLETLTETELAAWLARGSPATTTISPALTTHRSLSAFSRSALADPGAVAAMRRSVEGHFAIGAVPAGGWTEATETPAATHARAPCARASSSSFE